MGKKICIVDNTEYEYCGKCDKNTPPQRWRNTFCCENCKGIYGVVNKYVFGHATKQTASVMLQKYDLSKLKSFNPEVKSIIDEILKKEAKKKTDEEK